MGLKYIYAGYSKCGTKTMAKVFKTLGFKVFDYEENCVYLHNEWAAYFDPKKSKEERIAMLRSKLVLHELMNFINIFCWFLPRLPFLCEH